MWKPRYVHEPQDDVMSEVIDDFSTLGEWERPCSAMLENMPWKIANMSQPFSDIQPKQEVRIRKRKKNRNPVLCPLDEPRIRMKLGNLDDIKRSQNLRPQMPIVQAAPETVEHTLPKIVKEVCEVQHNKALMPLLPLYKFRNAELQRRVPQSKDGVMKPSERRVSLQNLSSSQQPYGWDQNGEAVYSHSFKRSTFVLPGTRRLESIPTPLQETEIKTDTIPMDGQLTSDLLNMLGWTKKLRAYNSNRNASEASKFVSKRRAVKYLEN